MKCKQCLLMKWAKFRNPWGSHDCKFHKFSNIVSPNSSGSDKHLAFGSKKSIYGIFLFNYNQYIGLCDSCNYMKQFHNHILNVQTKTFYTNWYTWREETKALWTFLWWNQARKCKDVNKELLCKICLPFVKGK